jgi:glycosyltransferase involved in cell wall biosynthesis
MDMPLVSAIIPVYNGERYLAEALQSIFDQDYRPLEVIVVDDGSTDGTAAVARSFDVRYVYQPNAGHAAARNAGIAIAKGEFIAPLDADDLWAPNKLSVQIDYLLKHPEVGYAICNQRTILEPGISKPSWVRGDQFSEDTKSFGLGALVIRREVLDQVGLFDTTYWHGNDSDWFFRANDAGVQMGYVPETLFYRRVHDSNMSYRVSELRADLLQVARASVGRKRESAG